jgi:DNA-binding MarR family transcriptional regulator
VSESVAKLRDQGLVHTSADPCDKRRTLVRVSDEHPRTLARKGAVCVDLALARSLGYDDLDAAREVLDVLTVLSQRLRPAAPGPILGQLGQAQQHLGSE